MNAQIFIKTYNLRILTETLGNIFQIIIILNKTFIPFGLIYKQKLFFRFIGEVICLIYI
jgi:hypothetical protein